MSQCEFKYFSSNLHKSLNTRNHAALDKNTWNLLNFHLTCSEQQRSLVHTVSPDKIQHGPFALMTIISLDRSVQCVLANKLSPKVD